MAIVQNMLKSVLGHDGQAYMEGKTYCAQFEVGNDFRAYCCENASCLRRWLIGIVREHFPDIKPDVAIGLGEAATNAFKHCEVLDGAQLAVSAKVKYIKDLGVIAVEIVNLGMNCPSVECDLPLDALAEGKRGLPIIKALEDDDILRNVRFESVKLEGIPAVKFSCEVPIT